MSAALAVLSLLHEQGRASPRRARLADPRSAHLSQLATASSTRPRAAPLRNLHHTQHTDCESASEACETKVSIKVQLLGLRKKVSQSDKIKPNSDKCVHGLIEKERN